MKVYLCLYQAERLFFFGHYREYIWNNSFLFSGLVPYLSLCRETWVCFSSSWPCRVVSWRVLFSSGLPTACCQALGRREAVHTEWGWRSFPIPSLVTESWSGPRLTAFTLWPRFLLVILSPGNLDTKDLTALLPGPGRALGVTRLKCWISQWNAKRGSFSVLVLITKWDSWGVIECPGLTSTTESEFWAMHGWGRSPWESQIGSQSGELLLSETKSLVRNYLWEARSAQPWALPGTLSCSWPCCFAVALSDSQWTVLATLVTRGSSGASIGIQTVNKFVLDRQRPQDKPWDKTHAPHKGEMSTSGNQSFAVSLSPS